jgi:hypothetical protein
MPEVRDWHFKARDAIKRCKWTAGVQDRPVWLLGIVFQYFTIKPMRDLSVAEGIWAVIKADTLSILTFQIGMYGWMALVYFKVLPNSSSSAERTGLLAHDAGRYDLRLRHGVTCQPAVSKDRLEGNDGMTYRKTTLDTCSH